VIRPGEEWGKPATAPADLEVEGADTDLAAAVAHRPGVLVRFRPNAASDLAGAVGLGREGLSREGLGGVEVPLDLLRLEDGPVAANMIVLGTAPDALGPWTRRFGAGVRIDGKSVFHGPCTTIVIATGQFRHGLDVVPRGHPGDGRAEVQIYAVSARQRRQLRARLATGTHVPHPDITQRSGARVTVSVDRRVAQEIDGRPAPVADRVDVTVVPNAYRLLL
jgi:YegS C-terminal NAD kinase beta sandwich-like domain